MEIKLKPCPFCGAEASYKSSTQINIENMRIWIQCTNNECQCRTDNYQLNIANYDACRTMDTCKDTAAKVWNRRVTDMREEDDGR